MSEQPGRAPSWTPAAIRELAMNFQSSRVLLTAVELRVFSLIGDGGLTSADVAGRAGSHPRATDRLLNALCALRLLVKRDGRYWNTPEARRYLDDGSPEFAAGLAHTASMWHGWSGLTDAVREGRPALRAAINERGDAWLKPFIAAMHYRAAHQAPEVAVLVGLDGVGRVLDVGGGSGAFAMAFAAKAPGLVAVVFDLPNVLPLTRDYIAGAGLSGRVTTAAGDYLADPLPKGFDSRVPVGRHPQQFAGAKRLVARLVRGRPQPRRAGRCRRLGNGRRPRHAGCRRLLRAQHAGRHRPGRHVHRRRDPWLDELGRPGAGAENRHRQRHQHRHRARPFTGMTGRGPCASPSR